ncbi:hypothetical protein TGAMA5MH_10692 [Trichoderma gamsii]|uniref:Uncharacterized protein n=1 Tax=Trichoderma gamsii TaxID=398673 RepID=A0A2K0SVT5_9HYPO|nr:hypothetical protein TGAMA5MH_10692 [Trichoderma gamsii]
MATPNIDEAVVANNLFNVDGLVAFITGGGTGIGLMMARALAKNGAAKVYIGGRRLEVLEEAAASLGPNVVPVKCDVTSKESLQQAVDFIKQDTGYLNVLVCNSGIGGPNTIQIQDDTSIEEWADSNWNISFEDYTNTFAVNTSAVWYTAIAFLKLLDAGNKKGNLEQSSQIIVTSSIASFNKAAPGGWAYGQSKAAATHIAKHLSTALPRWNIRTNCIAPGLFPSEMAAPIVNSFNEKSDTPGKVPAQFIPLQRMGNDQDMAGTILYLISRSGAYCNGLVIVIDGGRLLRFPSLY